MSVTTMSLKISMEDYEERCRKLRDTMIQRGCSAVVLFDRTYILYYCGFGFIPTERPMAFVMTREGEKLLFVPRLEEGHARTASIVDDVSTYVEYPGERHPMMILNDELQQRGIQGPIAVDEDGYPWIVGYQGPPLSEVTGGRVTRIRADIERQMMVKSPAEISMIRESVRWGNLAHMLLQRYTVVGATETEVSQRASDEASRAMVDAIGPIYRALSMDGSGNAGAGYRGQIGRNSEIPHALANNLTFQKGDQLVTGASADVWGYCSELERTMFLGEPTREQQRFFSHIVALQDLAFETMGPGIPCQVVDKTVSAYYEKHDLLKYWKHHTGHAIGLRYHEAPFMDRGDQTELLPGMVMTVEPGLYVPDLGGFRHSDTVLVTENGIEIMTYYPRDLLSLTLPA